MPFASKLTRIQTGLIIFGFLWGYCKENIYKNKLTNVADLKTEIEIFLAEIWVFNPEEG